MKTYFEDKSENFYRKLIMLVCTNIYSRCIDACHNWTVHIVQFLCLIRPIITENKNMYLKNGIHFCTNYHSQHGMLYNLFFFFCLVHLWNSFCIWENSSKILILKYSSYPKIHCSEKIIRHVFLCFYFYRIIYWCRICFNIRSVEQNW